MSFQRAIQDFRDLSFWGFLLPLLLSETGIIVFHIESQTTCLKNATVTPGNEHNRKHHGPILMVALMRNAILAWQMVGDILLSNVRDFYLSQISQRGRGMLGLYSHTLVREKTLAGVEARHVHWPPTGWAKGRGWKSSEEWLYSITPALELTFV